jgi:hypothetical protein
VRPNVITGHPESLARPISSRMARVVARVSETKPAYKTDLKQ